MASSRTTPQSTFLLRGRSDAELPLVFGNFWRCDTVAGLEARAAETLRIVSPRLPGRGVALDEQPLHDSDVLTSSPAEAFLEVPHMAWLLVETVVAYIGDDEVITLDRALMTGRALQEMGQVCSALRSATEPQWRRLALRLRLRTLPVIPTEASEQWRALCYMTYGHVYGTPCSLVE